MRIRKIFYVKKLCQALLSGGCFENTAHTTVSLLTPPHLSCTLFFPPLFSMIQHIITRAHSLGRLMAFLVCLIKYWPLEGLLFLWVKVECATDHMCCDNTGRHAQLSSLPRWERHWASFWQLQRTEQPSNRQECDYILKSHSDSCWDLSRWGEWRCLDMYSNTSIAFGFEYCSCETLH